MASVPHLTFHNGCQMPVVGLGTWQAREGECRSAVLEALRCGYRHIDTATLYQNEAEIGLAVHTWLKETGGSRDQLFITTKLPSLGLREADVERHLKKSLQKLQLDYVDLYLIHSPVGMIGKHDEDFSPRDADGNVVLDTNTDLEAVWRAMEKQVDAGRAKSIGLSNFNSVQIERIMKSCRVAPANLQVEVHAYHNQRALREVCGRHGITVCAYGPLAAPYKTKRLGDNPVLLQHPAVTAVAQRVSRTPAQVLLRFLVQLGVSVIPKSSNPQRLRENLDIFEFTLGEKDMKSLEALDLGPDGKLFIFRDSQQGYEKHPEYPFSIPY